LDGFWGAAELAHAGFLQKEVPFTKNRECYRPIGTVIAGLGTSKADEMLLIPFAAYFR